VNTRNLAVVGIQWGDEGKGKIVDYHASSFDYVVRFQGGANAGHTVVVEGRKFVFHLLPSGVLHAGTVNVIGNGVVVDLGQLCREIDEAEEYTGSLAGRLHVSGRALVVLPFHKERDRLAESAGRKIGTTLRGIGPVYADKAARRGFRVCELLDGKRAEEKIRFLCRENNILLEKVYGAEPVDADAVVEEVFRWGERVRPFVSDTVSLLHEALGKGKSILFEGAQGAMLDVDFGTYPFVTSSNTTTGGILTGCGVPPSAVGRVLGVAKSYCTRVGEGPMPTELEDETGERLRERGGEYGATTGRPRRCGWFDAVAASYAVAVSGVTEIALTKLDVLDGVPEVKVCTGYRFRGKDVAGFPADAAVCGECEPRYEVFEGWRENTEDVRSFEDLPPRAREYVRGLEKLLGVRVSMISTGRERNALIVRG